MEKKKENIIDLVSILASCMWAEVFISSDLSQSSSQKRLRRGLSSQRTEYDRIHLGRQIISHTYYASSKKIV